MDMDLWNDLLRRADDRDRVDAAVARGRINPGAGKFTVKLNCWDRAEADELLIYARNKYPGVEFFATWPNFERSWKIIQEFQKYNGRS